jgi:hypothetical protein
LKEIEATYDAAREKAEAGENEQTEGGWMWTAEGRSLLAALVLGSFLFIDNSSSLSLPTSTHRSLQRKRER